MFKTNSKSIAIFLILCVITKIAVAQPVTTTQDNYFELSKNIDIYYNLLKEVNQLYVDPIQPGKMVKKSIDAMLNDLDPYTNFYSEDDIEDYRFQSTGKYGGVGCVPVASGDYIAIDDVFENGPAAKAGLKIGDIITAIDGKSIKNKKDDEISKLIKGSPGTVVKFTVKNPFSNNEVEKTITREEININNIAYSGLIGPDKNIAYVRLIQFTERCSNNVKVALDSLKKVNQNLKGVVIDLRGNPGGLLDEAVNMCNLFIPKNQLVVTTKGKVAEWQKEYKTNQSSWDETIPVTVLINKNSASASEIVSGTLQDLDRGVVVGQKSFGKGLVQTTRKLTFNAQVKITTAKYYTPSGRCIQALDYSHRNDDGSVGEVPDSIKSKFKTKIGRTVFDGGGVEPDVTIASAESNKLVQTLYAKSLFFDYANKYANEHASIANAETFKLSDTELNEFINWLNTKEYSYKTKTEDQLEKLKATAEKEKTYNDIKAQFTELQKALTHDKLQDLQKNKTDLAKILQLEIVKRYYYSKGKYANSLAQDAEVQEAISVLNDGVRYKKILSN